MLADKAEASGECMVQPVTGAALLSAPVMVVAPFAVKRLIDQLAAVPVGVTGKMRS